MLQHTYIHLPGVGHITESRLWGAGARHWDNLKLPEIGERLRATRLGWVSEAIEESRSALRQRDAGYFWSRLPSSDHWRLFEEFADRAAYVDIETTGPSAFSDEITVIVVRANDRTQTFIKGKNLDRFPEVVSRFPLLITFNGASFDLPFLRKRFRKFRPVAHLDLRYPLKWLGYVGGLKAIERDVGMKRPSHLKELDGFDAVQLWYRHLRGDRRALALLVEYAAADVESLEPLAELAAGALATKLGFPKRTCLWGAHGSR
ncbi:MAG: ribonuclease H-like domain-containing protein [Candidatus Eisenbacteria bacterium]